MRRAAPLMTGTEAARQPKKIRQLWVAEQKTVLNNKQKLNQRVSSIGKKKLTKNKSGDFTRNDEPTDLNPPKTKKQ